MSLPGNKQTLAGTLSGVSFGVSQNFSVRQTNLIVPTSVSAYYGGVEYRVAAFSKWLDNVSPQLNGMHFQLRVNGDVGIDRVTNGADAHQHWSFLAGGTLNYQVAGSSTYSLLSTVQYGKLPGYANNTWLVAVGPSIHF
jgi:hypothetical protein